MPHYAILLGSAQEYFRQKKIEKMFNFLDSKKNAGDSIVTFANGISEMMLEMVLDNSIKQLTENSEQTTQQDREQKVRHCEPQQLRHCERSKAILETDEGDCFVANAPRNDGNITNEPRNDGNITNDSCNDVNCHSEFISESADEMLNQVQHDGNICHCEPIGEAISETNGDCFVANAPRNDVKISHSELDSESADEILKRVQHNALLLYICSLHPVGDDEKSIWLGKEEIRCDVISHYQTLAKECGIDMQVVMDCDNEVMSEEELGYEKVCEQLTENRFRNTENSKKMLKQVQHDGVNGGAR